MACIEQVLGLCRLRSGPNGDVCAVVAVAIASAELEQRAQALRPFGT